LCAVSLIRITEPTLISGAINSERHTGPILTPSFKHLSDNTLSAHIATNLTDQIIGGPIRITIIPVKI
jgi:hypothetical protein